MEKLIFSSYHNKKLQFLNHRETGSRLFKVFWKNEETRKINDKEKSEKQPVWEKFWFLKEEKKPCFSCSGSDVWIWIDYFQGISAPFSFGEEILNFPACITISSGGKILKDFLSRCKSLFFLEIDKRSHCSVKKDVLASCKNAKFWFLWTLYSKFQQRYLEKTQVFLLRISLW